MSSIVYNEYNLLEEKEKNKHICHCPESVLKLGLTIKTSLNVDDTLGTRIPTRPQCYIHSLSPLSIRSLGHMNNTRLMIFLLPRDWSILFEKY